MIKNILFNLNSNKALYLVLACMVSLYVNSLQARTLIFQAGSEPSQSQETQTGQILSDKQAKPTELVNTSTSTNSLSANSELFFMIEQLQSEVNSLRGLLEEQSYELRMLKKSAKDRYLDLDTRILELTKRASQSETQTISVADKLPVEKAVTGRVRDVVPANSKSISEELVTPAQKEPTKAEQKAYDDAYSLIKSKMFDESILALFNYTENHPNSPLMPNVYYWLGEVYLATSKLEQAKTSFSLVINAYPSNPKAPDSLYKLAVTLDRLGEYGLAKQYLKDVQDNYPNSTASKLASAYKLSQ